MAHSIISDEINASTLKYSSWASLNVNKYQLMYSISSIEDIDLEYHGTLYL